MTSSTEGLVTQQFPAAHPVTGAHVDHVALVMLNRPAALNALNRQLMTELLDALTALDADPDCRCIVIRGAGERAFAAGADIKEMAPATSVSLAAVDDFARWDEVARLATPLIAAVRGYALGGGCELAMACDIIVAGDDATFGQPEVGLGIIPGAGGTQRLTRAVGRGRAMELILTGRMIDADEAVRIGLVAKVVPAADTLQEAVELAARIAAHAPLAVRAAKAAIARADELPLSAGIEFERRAFFLLFATDDQKEGMDAFINKRPPVWRGR